jgi:peptide deformylase
MAKLLDIVTHPAKSLRERSAEIDPKELKNMRELIADMKLTMEKKDGVGLAAPQIGNNIRMIVISTKDGPLAMINPVLKNLSFFKEWGEEGCLSVPGKYGQVKRHRSLKCEYLDDQGNKKAMQATGLMARILQHEVDHLDGVLFIDKAKDIEEFEAKQ